VGEGHAGRARKSQNWREHRILALRMLCFTGFSAQLTWDLALDFSVQAICRFNEGAMSGDENTAHSRLSTRDWTKLPVAVSHALYHSFAAFLGVRPSNRDHASSLRGL
jgi:hypothetical protein